MKFWAWSGADVCNALGSRKILNTYSLARIGLDTAEDGLSQVRKSCRAWQMLQNEYLLPKVCFDTAENEPSKIWQI